MKSDGTKKKAFTYAHKKNSKKMTRITISIDPNEYETVEKIAENDERSASWVIRKAVSEFLERQDKEVLV